MSQKKLNPALALRVLLAASAMYLGVPAHAAASADINTVSFAELDANSDGSIDAKEAAALPSLQSSMAQFDANKDGKLSAQEYTAAASQLKKQQ